jgi:hypothetical protein
VERLRPRIGRAGKTTEREKEIVAMIPGEILNEIRRSSSLSALADAGDAAGIVAALNAKTIQHTDHTLYGPAGLIKKLPPQVVEAAAQSFEAASAGSATMRLLVQTFATYGFDFADAATIANLDMLVTGGMPVEIADALKSVGTWHTSIADGYTGAATLENVQAALALRATAEVYAAVAARYNATVAAMDAGTVTTLAEAKTFFAGQ